MVARWVSAILLLLLCLIQAGLWLGDGGLGHVHRLRQQLGEQQQRNQAQQQANDRLMAEVDDLKRGLEMVEERARIELGMVKADEVYVQYANAAAGRAGQR